MDLPRGTLAVCTVPLRPDPGRPLPVSFDQARHVGAGDRAGSWMALAFRMPHLDIRRDLLGAAWARTVARHGTLTTVFFPGPEQARLHAAAADAPEWAAHAAGNDPRVALRAVLDAGCRPFAAPSHRLVLLEPDDGSDPVVVVAADHAHVDMWSLLVLARDLSLALGAGAPVAEPPEHMHGVGGAPPDPAPPPPELTHPSAVAPPDPAPPFAEHTRLLADAPPAPASVAARWHRILGDGDGLMPLFPLPLGDVSTPRPEVVEVRDVLDAASARRFADRAAAAGVRVAAFAVSILAGVTRDVAGAPLRAVFPVHSRFEPRWHDAVGWFITNAVLDCADGEPTSGAAAIRGALSLGSYPLAPLLAPWGGMPATPGMFAISWLDARRIPIDHPAITDVQWVSAATDTDGVMIWFLATDDGLHLRVRYPDTPPARASVPRWVDAAQSALAAAAAPVLPEPAVR